VAQEAATLVAVGIAIIGGLLVLSPVVEFLIDHVPTVARWLYPRTYP